MGMIWVGYRRAASVARQLLEDEELLGELLDSDDDVTSLDLDKAWHGLHWILTGSAEPGPRPLSDVIFGGEAVGMDLGYGPPRLLAADRVAAVSDALRGIPQEDLRSRVDAAAMAQAQVYPQIWDEDDVFDEYLAPALDHLRDFYAAAAAAGEAVIQTIC